MDIIESMADEKYEDSPERVLFSKKYFIRIQELKHLLDYLVKEKGLRIHKGDFMIDKGSWWTEDCTKIWAKLIASKVNKW